jgi:hypothetical protein
MYFERKVTFHVESHVLSEGSAKAISPCTRNSPYWSVNLLHGEIIGDTPKMQLALEGLLKSAGKEGEATGISHLGPAFLASTLDQSISLD